MTCFIDMDVDGSIDFVSDKIVKARKQHKCCECGDTIEPGTTYEKTVGVWDREFSTFKTCEACVEIRKRYFCTWYYGMMWETLLEEYAEHLTVGDVDGLSLAAVEKLESKCGWYDD